MEVPDTPYHRQSAEQMSQFATQFGPEMEKFFSGMMAHGGLPDINSMLDQTRQLGDLDRRATAQTVQGSMHPAGSTAQTRAMAGSLDQGDLQRQLMMSQLGMQAQEGAMGRQFAGAQGLSGMPGIYGAPSSIEASMFGIRSPYDMANFNADLQTRLQRQSSMDNWMTAMGLYQPDRIQSPSDFEKYVSPFLDAAMKGLGAYFGLG